VDWHRNQATDIVGPTFGDRVLVDRLCTAMERSRLGVGGCFRQLLPDGEHAKQLARLRVSNPAFFSAVMELNQALVRLCAAGELEGVIKLTMGARPGELIRMYVARAFLGACAKRHGLVVEFMLEQGVTRALSGVDGAAFAALLGTPVPVELAPRAPIKASALRERTDLELKERTDLELKECAELEPKECTDLELKEVAKSDGPGEWGTFDEAARAKEDAAAMEEEREAAATALGEALLAAGGDDPDLRTRFVLQRLSDAGWSMSDVAKAGSDQEWDTVLHIAARRRLPRTVEWLASVPGVDRGGVNGADLTPLGEALASGEEEVVAVLEALGAPSDWRRGSEEWVERQTESAKESAVQSAAERHRVSSGMSCGFGGFQPPTADELESLPFMEGCEDTAASSATVRVEADGGMTLSTFSG
jgi:hypothetical protein